MYSKYREQDLTTHPSREGSRLQRVWFREVTLYYIVVTVPHKMVRLERMWEYICSYMYVYPGAGVQRFH